MGERIRIGIDGHVAVVTLARPDKRNALDLPMLEALDAAGTELAGNPALRACVLEGEGGHFSAGIDLSVLQGGTQADLEAALAPLPGSPANLFQRAAWAWRELPVPVICAITGVAYGGGLQLALGADIRYARADAQFSVMEVAWGIVPDMALTQTLARIARPDRIKELALTGRVFDGAEAEAVGVVTALADDPSARARELAEDIASKSPDAVRAIKRLLDEAQALAPDAALRLEAELQLGLLGRPNQREAVAARLERREPRFTNPGTGD
ncbi:MAG: crotonase/enoyl-CoA hydratase family protein [Woeseiaceae bacterium]|nr:crotonase/enoyl-CoA hydratase family protein [Woeseiaceae bacterium]